jgi:hypothetical protein
MRMLTKPYIVTMPIIDELRSKFLRGSIHRREKTTDNFSTLELIYVWEPSFADVKTQRQYPSLQASYSRGKFSYTHQEIDGKRQKVLSNVEQTNLTLYEVQQGFVYDLRRWFELKANVAPCLMDHINTCGVLLGNYK